MSLMRRIVGWFVVVAVVGGIGSGIYYRLSGSEPEGEATGGGEVDRPEVSASTSFNAAVAIPVSGAVVVRDTLVISVTAAAQAVAWKETQILAQVPGQIIRIPVSENQTVRRGQRLLALDTVDLGLDLDDARAGLSSAEADYRERTLFDDAIEDESIRAEREQGARAKSGIDRAQIAVTQAELKLRRATARAPFGGRIADIVVADGAWVRQGDPLMTVVDIDPIKVEVQVLESEIGYLRQGGLASISFAAFPNEVFTGQIETINPMIDATSRTARVTVLVPNPEGRVLPGMYARVALEARRFADRILVPKSAILERSNRTMLFVYEPDGRAGFAKWHYVTTGLENDSLVEIIENRETDMLQPGQQVLTEGHYTLIHDARVRLVRDPRAVGGRPQ